jgi:hypothetical protein
MICVLPQDLSGKQGRFQINNKVVFLLQILFPQQAALFIIRFWIHEGKGKVRIGWRFACFPAQVIKLRPLENEPPDHFLGFLRIKPRGMKVDALFLLYVQSRTTFIIVARSFYSSFTKSK